MKVVNIFSGPGTGKSTTAAELYVLLKKKKGLRVEMVKELAAELVHAESFLALKDLPYMRCAQNHRLFMLKDKVDYLLVDTGAGINDNVLYFNLAAQERIVVLTPEPTSLTDAYAVVKVMKQNHGVHHFKIVVNMASDKKNAAEVFKRLYQACDHFLDGVSLEFSGFIPRDAAVRDAVIRQRPLCDSGPDGHAAKAVAALAQKVQSWEAPVNLDGYIKFFWKKLLFIPGS
jgi:MinD-like ATPase involved in chromosome partitioning or flagellar assembly